MIANKKNDDDNEILTDDIEEVKMGKQINHINKTLFTKDIIIEKR